MSSHSHAPKRLFSSTTSPAASPHMKKAGAQPAASASGAVEKNGVHLHHPVDPAAAAAASTNGEGTNGEEEEMALAEQDEVPAHASVAANRFRKKAMPLPPPPPKTLAPAPLKTLRRAGEEEEGHNNALTNGFKMQECANDVAMTAAISCLVQGKMKDADLCEAIGKVEALLKKLVGSSMIVILLLLVVIVVLIAK